MNRPVSATQVHDQVCGCDQKQCPWLPEIDDWLLDSDLTGMETLSSLVHMWNERESDAYHALSPLDEVN